MAIYAIAIHPLIDSVQNEAMQIWYADDATASGKLPNLKEWWDKLSVSGPDFGYFPMHRRVWLSQNHRILRKLPESLQDAT